MKICVQAAHGQPEILLEGRSFGAEGSVQGELVFNTGINGYVENLSDPSYCGQILLFSQPLQGNYGVPAAAWESLRVQPIGVVVLREAKFPNHHSSIQSLGDCLIEQGVPGICDVDTRFLTRRLRSGGVRQAALLTDTDSPEDYFSGKLSHLQQENMSDVLSTVAYPEAVRYGSGPAKILLIDTGAKENILRCLVTRETTVFRVPWHYDWESLLPELDGVFIGNGPGNPQDAMPLVERMKASLFSANLPVFGICLGHQLLCLAGGGTTKKMKFGHRSMNQPVMDLRTKRAYVTSQNHGFVVDEGSMGEEWLTTFVNLNDQTNEGIAHRKLPIQSVQFHPEASPGPRESAFLFDDYMKLVNTLKKGRKPKYSSRLIGQFPERGLL